MTRDELNAKVGSKELGDIAVNMILDSIKMPFFEAIVRGKLKDIESKIRDMEADGYIYECNGSYHVNWGKENEPYERTGHTVWDAPVSVNEESQANYLRCTEADLLIYHRNLYTHMIAVK